MKIKVNKHIKVVFWIITILFPLLFYIENFDISYGFTDLIYFGEFFSENAISKLQETPHKIKEGFGYDGQFYAQIALDPLLLNEELPQAIDSVSYRSRRIFLPFLSFIFGLGIPVIIINIYAILNLFFYYILLFIVNKYLKPSNLHEFLILVPILYGTGTFFSYRMSLPDLPSTVLIFIGIFSQTPIFFSLAFLTKETTIVNILGIIRSDQSKLKNLQKMIAVSLPLMIWILYISLRLGISGSFGSSGNFAFPGTAIIHQATNLFGKMLNPFDFESFTMLLALISITFQSLFMFFHPNPRNPIWRVGVASAVLFLFLGEEVLMQDIAFCRALLPLTFSFNFLLKDNENNFFKWLIIGNMGLFGGIGRTIFLYNWIF